MTDDPTSSSWRRDLPATPALSVRSRFVSDFFDRLNQEDVAWVVMNNYEGLPEVIPSDIDFSIPAELFRRLDSFIADFVRASDAQIVQKLWHGNMKCAYILSMGPKGAREFVQLDFFTAFSTKGCPALIAHQELVAERRVLRNFHVPRPEVELIFTVMRRLFKNDWSPRHCTRIAELYQEITRLNWLAEPYAWMRPTIEAAIRGDVVAAARRRDGDWACLRANARRNLSLRERILNAVLQTRRVVARLRDETGQLVILAAPRKSIGAAALNSLELVFHRRLFLDGPAGITLPVRLALLKRRKGLIFVLAGAGQPRGQALARQLARMRLADQVLYTGAGPNAGPPDFGLAATELNSDAEAIEAILTVQAAKAATAIARGGTQTSGVAK